MATSAAPEGPADAGPGPAPGAPRRLSDELADLRARSETAPLTLREIIRVLRGRAYLLLVMLLALPFLTPIPLPGLSTPFGLAIGLIAFRLVLGQRPWLPKKLQRKEVPPGFFGRLMKVAGYLIRFLEKFLRPRLVILTDTALLVRLHALLMLAAAFVLLLPLPIPFTNTFPGWAILLLAGGLLERDGAAIVAGYLMFAVGTLYFLFLGEAAAEGVRLLVEWLRGG